MIACDEAIPAHSALRAHFIPGKEDKTEFRKVRLEREARLGKTNAGPALPPHEFQSARSHVQSGTRASAAFATKTLEAPRKAYTRPSTYITPPCSGFSHTAKVKDAASLGEGGEEKQLLRLLKIKLVALPGDLGRRSRLSAVTQLPRPADRRGT